MGKLLKKYARGRGLPENAEHTARTFDAARGARRGEETRERRGNVLVGAREDDDDDDDDDDDEDEEVVVEGRCETAIDARASSVRARTSRAHRERGGGVHRAGVAADSREIRRTRFGQDVDVREHRE